MNNIFGKIDQTIDRLHKTENRIMNTKGFELVKCIIFGVLIVYGALIKSLLAVGFGIFAILLSNIRLGVLYILKRKKLKEEIKLETNYDSSKELSNDFEEFDEMMDELYEDEEDEI